MFDDLEDEEQGSYVERPAYMSQPAMQAHANQLALLIDGLHEDSSKEGASVEVGMFCDIMITIYHQVVLEGKADEMASLFRVLYRGALDESNPTAWEDLMRVPMTTTN